MAEPFTHAEVEAFRQECNVRRKVETASSMRLLATLDARTAERAAMEQAWHEGHDHVGMERRALNATTIKVHFLDAKSYEDERDREEDALVAARERAEADAREYRAALVVGNRRHGHPCPSCYEFKPCLASCQVIGGINPETGARVILVNGCTIEPDMTREDGSLSGSYFVCVECSAREGRLSPEEAGRLRGEVAGLRYALAMAEEAEDLAAMEAEQESPAHTEKVLRAQVADVEQANARLADQRDAARTEAAALRAALEQAYRVHVDVECPTGPACTCTAFDAARAALAGVKRG